MRYEGTVAQVKEIEKILSTAKLKLVDRGTGKDVFGNNGRPSQFQTVQYYVIDDAYAYYFKVCCVYDHRTGDASVRFAERDGGRMFRVLPEVVKLFAALKPENCSDYKPKPADVHIHVARVRS